MPSMLTSIAAPAQGLAQKENAGLSQWEIEQICEGSDPVRGLSQQELDELCHTQEDEVVEDNAEEEPGPSAAIYNAKRKRRITFSGMSAAISSVPLALAGGFGGGWRHSRSEAIPEDEEDLRGGFTQAALNRMSVAGEPSGNGDDSPIDKELLRKKRATAWRRISAGGAGADNMIKVAMETVGQGPEAQPLLQPAAPAPACESPARSPRKRRQKNNQSENICNSPSKNVGTSPTKSLQNSPAKMVGNVDPLSPPRKARLGAANPLSPLNPLNISAESPLNVSAGSL